MTNDDLGTREINGTDERPHVLSISPGIIDVFDLKLIQSLHDVNRFGHTRLPGMKGRPSKLKTSDYPISEVEAKMRFPEFLTAPRDGANFFDISSEVIS